MLGARVALKVARGALFEKRGCRVAGGLPQLANELRVLRHVRHPNIAEFHGAVVDVSSGSVALVLELVGGGDLEAFIRGGTCQPKSVSVCIRRSLLLDICCALRYLHSRQPCIVHGDLKPSNVLVEHLVQRPRAKLIDFGLARILKGTVKPLGGSLVWRAPEVIKHGKVPPHSSADVFSLGCLMFFVATQLKPPADRSRRSTVQYSHEDQFLPWPPGCQTFPLPWQQVAEKCVRINPSERPSVIWISECFSQPSGDGKDVDHDERCVQTVESADFIAGLRQLKEVADGFNLGAEVVGNDRDSQPSFQRPQVTPWSAVMHSPRAMVAEEHEGCNSTESPASQQEHGVNFAATASWSRRLSLLDVISRWSPQSFPHKCCALHGAAEDLQSYCQHLLSKPCKHTFGLGFESGTAQCSSCGLLHPGDANKEPASCWACSCHVSQWTRESPSDAPPCERAEDPSLDALITALRLSRRS
eukprot:gnl/TRDRNA2_/TRDRNA2_74054_c0_seq1.p1 gnl/TRDRNA2_/TRDRNA2_74054_c0~~gnl/TRDRNA2_/TRDRNA2_74054_c0_seq1.p1  ORF type:complete len:523 (-),score=35.93 gnl/TRDRNA2_/TRDRNA2_74054_c0_seq1:45-1463(-)